MPFANEDLDKFIEDNLEEGKQRRIIEEGINQALENQTNFNIEIIKNIEKFRQDEDLQKQILQLIQKEIDSQKALLAQDPQSPEPVKTNVSCDEKDQDNLIKLYNDFAKDKFSKKGTAKAEKFEGGVHLEFESEEQVTEFVQFLANKLKQESELKGKKVGYVVLLPEGKGPVNVACSDGTVQTFASVKEYENSELHQEMKAFKQESKAAKAKDTKPSEDVGAEALAHNYRTFVPAAAKSQTTTPESATDEKPDPKLDTSAKAKGLRK